MNETQNTTEPRVVESSGPSGTTVCLSESAFDEYRATFARVDRDGDVHLFRVYQTGTAQDFYVKAEEWAALVAIYEQARASADKAREEWTKRYHEGW